MHQDKDPDSTSNSLVQGLSLDQERRVLRVGERIVRLSRLEFALVKALLENAGRVVDTRELLASVWGQAKDVTCSTNQLKSLVQRLRKKVEDEPGYPRIILSVRGHGFMIERLQNASAVAKFETDADSIP